MLHVGWKFPSKMSPISLYMYIGTLPLSTCDVNQPTFDMEYKQTNPSLPLLIWNMSRRSLESLKWFPYIRHVPRCSIPCTCWMSPSIWDTSTHVPTSSPSIWDVNKRTVFALSPLLCTETSTHSIRTVPSSRGKSISCE